MPSEHRIRVALFTDTLADVNGVSRFIRDAAGEALRTSRNLTVVTSTALEMVGAAWGSNIINLRPRASWTMPGYATLQVVPPPMRRARRIIADLRPDAVHISTPGPVGVAGLLAARQARLPILGTYHTDFPAYVDHLFGDPSLEWLSLQAMRALYVPMARVFTRSADYARRLRTLGVHCSRITRLRPGTDVETFHPRHRDESLWARLGCNPASIKVLCIGRVSVEKNLPMLAKVWPGVRQQLAATTGLSAELVVVGDGPYRVTMEQKLAGHNATFLGFRHCQELSAIYASSDMLVFPSATDTLGQVAMEAQASGLPVLVSDSGGPREVVRHGRTGMVLRADDARAWIQAIAGLVANPDQRREMGLAGRMHMEQHGFSRSFAHWWDVHETAVGRARVPDLIPLP